MDFNALVLFGAKEAGCFREVGASHNDHHRQVQLFKHPNVGMYVYAVPFFEWLILLVALQGHTARTLLEHRTQCMPMYTLSSKILMVTSYNLMEVNAQMLLTSIGFTYTLTDCMHDDCWIATRLWFNA